MKKNNIYRNAREQYNKSTANTLNREDAAEHLHISQATLGRYETGDSSPDPMTVYNMSILYENPLLRRRHCSQECTIGKVDHPFDIPKTIFESGYGLINANKSIGLFKDELFEVLADGTIDKDEIIRLKELIPHIKNVKKLLDDIEIELEKYALKHQLKD